MTVQTPKVLLSGFDVIKNNRKNLILNQVYVIIIKDDAWRANCIIGGIAMAKKETADKAKIITKELWGMVLTLFSAVCLFCLFTGDSVFYPLGEYVSVFLRGVFGYFAFPLFVFLLFVGIMMIIGKKVVGGRGLVTAIAFSLMFINVFFIIHLALFSPSGKEFGAYLGECYYAASKETLYSSVGGAAAGIIIHPICNLISTFGAYVLFAIVVFLGALVALRDKMFKRNAAGETEYGDKPKVSGDDFANAKTDENSGEEKRSPIVNRSNGKKLVIGDDSFELKSENYENNKDDERANTDNSSSASYTEDYNRSFADKMNYVRTPQKIDPESIGKPVSRSMFSTAGGYLEPERTDEDDMGKVYIPENYKTAVGGRETDEDERVKYTTISDDVNVEDESASDDSFIDNANYDFDSDDEVDDSEQGVYEEEISDDYIDTGKRSSRRAEFVSAEIEDTFDDDVKPPLKEETGRVNPFDEMPLNFKYNAPPIDLLRVYKSNEDYSDVERFIREKSEVIVKTLKVLNDIDARVVNTVHGPTVTRFDLEIPDNVSVKNVVKYTEDLRLRLKTQNDIRFCTIPGTSYVGVEVPNDRQATVGLRSVIESNEFKEAKQTSLTFAIGQDIVGNPVVADIAKMPHLLMAGATGTGKSVGLNSLLVSLMYKYSPQDLRFIIVDPKLVEFAVFNGIPHMLFNEIFFDAQKAVAMLNWAIKEMEARYAKFRDAEVRNITEYNMQIDPRRERRLPKIIIILDEFADLMNVDKKNIEDKIARLAQKARAAGIHLILATQRPSVNIIEGSIKTNFTSRITFKMTNAIDSNTILNETGAEKLLGKGDLLYKMSYMTNIERAQGAFVDMDEIKEVVKYIKDHNKCYFNEDALAAINNEVSPQIESVNGRDDDSADVRGVPKDNLFALYVAIQLGEVSISMLQRKMNWGFNKAGRIFDWMKAKGYIIESGMGKRQQVVMTKDQFMEQYGDDFSIEEFEDRFGLI